MAQKLFFYLCMAAAIPLAGICQNVGIGTSSPHPRAILELQSNNLAFLPPRMNNAQMQGMTSVPEGALIFNTQQQQHMAYVRSYTNTLIVNGNTITSSNFQWVPVSTGPRILAWGVIDTIPGAVIRNGSNNFSIEWKGYKFSSETFTASTENHYEISLTGNATFNLDSMMVHVTPIGSGTWDQAVSVWNTTDGKITVKFTDVSRLAGGDFSTTSQRRRSRFAFTVYDLRQVAR